MTTPTITGVSHVDLTVTDLDRSEEWYSRLLGAERILDARSDDLHLSSRHLLHRDSLLVIGLIRHDATEATTFDERCVGLDHLSLAVADRPDLDTWAARLDDLGVAHSGITDAEPWSVLSFRDPDNIALELFHLQPATAAQLLG